MNPNDYDEDGNNIVPCPICMSNYNPCKDGGKCPMEDEFVRDMNLRDKLGEQWQDKFLEAGTEKGLGDLSAMISVVSEILTAQITNTGEELMRRVEGGRRKLPQDAKEIMGELGVAEEKLRNFGANKALDTIKQHITKLTGVE